MAATLVWHPEVRPEPARPPRALALAEEVLATPDTDLETTAYAGYVVAFYSDQFAASSVPAPSSFNHFEIVALVQLGRIERARLLAERLLGVDPGFAIGKFRALRGTVRALDPAAYEPGSGHGRRRAARMTA